jgi:hypothetical protein
MSEPFVQQPEASPQVAPYQGLARPSVIQITVRWWGAGCARTAWAPAGVGPPRAASGRHCTATKFGLIATIKPSTKAAQQTRPTRTSRVRM